MKLRRFLEPPPPPVKAQTGCELCGQALAPQHNHLVELASRRILCACRPCYLLFAPQGAGRYRSIPERYRRVTLEGWEGLEIPVGLAFFFRNSELGKILALYPGPAGATESMLSTDELSLPPMEDDVEALIVRPAEAYVVPIDACYRLVGSLRQVWKGFDGGSEARAEVERFFAEARRVAA